jgi:hypothetical protein
LFFLGIQNKVNGTDLGHPPDVHVSQVSKIARPGAPVVFLGSQNKIKNADLGHPPFEEMFGALQQEALALARRVASLANEFADVVSGTQGAAKAEKARA